MDWAFLAAGSAFTHATLYALTKHLLKDVPRFTFLAWSYLVGGLLLMVVNLVVGLPVVGSGFLAAASVTILLNIVAAILYTQALQETDISLAFPMIAFTPAFLLVTSPLLRNECPSVLGCIGVLVIVAGAYTLNLRRDAGLLEPFRALRRDRGMRLMLVVAFLFSITSNFDKEATLQSSPLFTVMVVFLSWGAVYLLLSLREPQRSRLAWLRSGLVGVVPAASGVMQNTAMLTAIVPYVMAIKRTSLLFNLLYAKFLFREEHLQARAAGALLMLCGSALIFLA